MENGELWIDWVWIAVVNNSFFFSVCHLQIWITLAAWSRPYFQTSSREGGEELGLREDPAQGQNQEKRGCELT